jgi:hypothetical protein
LKCVGKYNSKRLKDKPKSYNNSKTLKKLYEEKKIKVWCNGLTKETDEKLRKAGKKQSKTKKKLFREGKLKTWNDGLTKKTNESLKRASEKIKLKTTSRVMSKRMSNIWKDIKNNPKKYKERIKIIKESRKKCPEKVILPKEKIIDLYLNSKKSTLEIAKMFKTTSVTILGKLKKWDVKRRTIRQALKGKEKTEEHIRNILKGRFKRPTKLETKFIGFFNRYSLSFNYCGDGSLIIGSKNPDFVENNGRKVCLETCNKIEKRWSYGSWKLYEKNRISHFAKYGWKCLVLWENELENQDNLIQKIRGTI